MVQFASRMNLLKGSEIRELLKLTAQPDILSFAGGMPAPELFPVEQMMEASIAVLKEHGREALQYSTTEGFPACASRSLSVCWPRTISTPTRITSSSPPVLSRVWTSLPACS